MARQLPASVVVKKKDDCNVNNKKKLHLWKTEQSKNEELSSGTFAALVA